MRKRAILSGACGACRAEMLRILGVVLLPLPLRLRRRRRGSVTCQVASVPILTKLESPSRLEGSLAATPTRASGACTPRMLRILGAVTRYQRRARRALM